MKRKSRRGALHPDAPLYQPDHPRPVTRRQFVAQGFVAGAATVIAPTLFGLFANPRAAQAALSPRPRDAEGELRLRRAGRGQDPVHLHRPRGRRQHGRLQRARRAGRAASATSSRSPATAASACRATWCRTRRTPASATNDFIESRLGLLFHLDSAFARGILERVSVTTAADINGAVIPARSENDTGNNPHNPMYGIFRAGADGELLTLIGSESSESGGNSMAPSYLINPSVRPTKIDRTSDVTGLVDTGKLVGLLDQDDAVRVMESIQRLSDDKLARVSTGITRDAVIKDLVRCNYVKAADLTDRYGDPSALNPELDPDIVGPDRHLHAGRVRQRRRVPQDRRGHEARDQRLRRRGHHHDGRLRLPRPGPRDRRAARPARGPLHGRLPRIRGAPRRAAHALRVQRRLALGGRRRRQHRRRPRQVRLVERQPADGRLVLPRLQPGRPRRSCTRATAGRPSSTSRSAGSGTTDRSRPRARRPRTTSTCWSKR